MSKLRPTLKDAQPGTPCMRNGTAYLMILNAVEQQPGLIHGQLVHGQLETPKGEYCAIGSYFHDNGQTALTDSLIDEVAAVNDSMPHLTPTQRKQRMMRWLKWKLAALGMPGFHRRKELGGRR
jgi:hypothetical protein